MYGGEHNGCLYRHIYDCAFGDMGCLRVADEDIAMKHLALFPGIGYLHHVVTLVLHNGEQSGV